MERRRKESDRLKNYGFVALAALELLVSFTSLGYIHVPPITITFAYIPVLIAGCFLGVARQRRWDASLVWPACIRLLPIM